MENASSLVPEVVLVHGRTMYDWYGVPSRSFGSLSDAQAFIDEHSGSAIMYYIPDEASEA